MSGILNSGKLATLLERVTAARAALFDNLSNLDATISSRPAGSDYTAARAAKLDNLDALVSSSGLAVPILDGLKGRYTTAQTIPVGDRPYVYGWYAASQANASSSTYDVWTTLLNVTSSAGVITWCALQVDTNTANLNTQARLSIDGVVVYTSATNAWSGGDDDDVLSLIGGYGHETIPFTDSFHLQFKITENSAGTVSMNHRTRYHITG